jgi:hypothetical protein
MARRSFDVLLEEGAKRTFASAADWPGWSRSGRDEASALEALSGYAVRYADVLDGSGVRFTAPEPARIRVAERVEGNATTDFGAPDGAFRDDRRVIDGAEWRRVRSIMEACWASFDGAVDAARGIELRKGPRGGGRELAAIVDHVVQAEAAYVRKLTGKGLRLDDDPASARRRSRDEVLEGLDRAAAGDLPETGPRGGRLWVPRRFLRRAAWHVLDHTWEIEDRATG